MEALKAFACLGKLACGAALVLLAGDDTAFIWCGLGHMVLAFAWWRWL